MYFKELHQRYDKKIKQTNLFDKKNEKKLQIIDSKILTNTKKPALIAENRKGIRIFKNNAKNGKNRRLQKSCRIIKKF